MIHVDKLTHLLVLATSVCAVLSIPLAHQDHENGFQEPSAVMERMSVDLIQQVALREKISSPSTGHDHKKTQMLSMTSQSNLFCYINYSASVKSACNRNIHVLQHFNLA
jgi:hypothetical protein